VPPSCTSIFAGSRSRWTGTGKTTLLNAVAQTIPAGDRIALIEETSEILIEQPNVVRLEARRAQAAPGQEDPMPAVTIAESASTASRIENRTYHTG
jgi:type IV secretory pathway ATPase VirB11/archaellum biosynthesis ATPase